MPGDDPQREQAVELSEPVSSLDFQKFPDYILHESEGCSLKEDVEDGKMPIFKGLEDRIAVARKYATRHCAPLLRD